LVGLKEGEVYRSMEKFRDGFGSFILGKNYKKIKMWSEKGRYRDLKNYKENKISITLSKATI
jgi:hypothetical protein